jgi:hypothetical protein
MCLSKYICEKLFRYMACLNVAESFRIKILIFCIVFAAMFISQICLLKDDHIVRSVKVSIWFAENYNVLACIILFKLWKQCVIMIVVSSRYLSGMQWWRYGHVEKVFQKWIIIHQKLLSSGFRFMIYLTPYIPDTIQTQYAEIKILATILWAKKQ